MAVELAVGYVSIVPSGRGFGRSLTRMGTTAGASAGSAASTSFGSQFVSGMASVARRASLAFTAGLGAAGFFAVRTAANFEQTRIAFEGILGDVDKANALLADLRDFANKTPFEFANLSKSAQQLLAVGVEAEDLIPTMSILGDVAAGLGAGPDAIEATVRALGQMKGKGKASAQELIQISEALPGFSAIAAIAEGLGVTTAEAFKLVENGAVSADESIALILGGMEKFPGAAGAMERQSKTLNGVISTFKDTLATTAIDFVTPYLPALSSGVAAFGGFLADMAARLKELIDSEGFKDFKATVGGAITDGLQAIVGWWDRNGESVTAFFVDFVATAGKHLGKLGDWIWDTVLPALRDFGTWVFEDGPGLEIVIAGIAAALGVYAFNAIIAAAASIAAIWPFVAFAVVVGTLSAATQWLIDKFDLMPNASRIFQLGIDNILPKLITVTTWAWNAAIAIGEFLDALARLPNMSLTSTRWSAREQELLDKAKIKGYDDGGRVGGPIGSPQLALVHGGETIWPTHKPGWSAPSPGGASGDITIQVIERPGENSALTAARELRRIQMLAA